MALDHDDFLEDDEDDDESNKYACQVIQRKHESFLRHFDEKEKDTNELPILHEEDESAKSGRLETSHPSTSDGAVLRNEEKAFSNVHNISPILKLSPERVEEEYDVFPNDNNFRENNKRKRIEDDSFDNISLMSVDSTKKSKFFRSGTKSLKRRMSIGIITPINNLFRQRRSSADTSTCSTMTNLESTFNESIKEPIKEKLRQIKDKVSKFTKKDSSTPKSTKTKLRMASANLSSLKDVCTLKNTKTEAPKTPEKTIQEAPTVEFKTPMAMPYPPNTPSIKSRYKFDESTISIDLFNSTMADKKLVFINPKSRENLMHRKIQTRIFSHLIKLANSHHSTS